jgi:DNA-binding beta-propeller fold protein YncE
MGKFGIVGPGYTGRSTNINASRCINFYPELNPEDSKSPAALIGTPGLLLYIDTQLGSIRGTHFFNNLIYFVSANKLYSVDAAKKIFPIIDSGTGLQIELATTEGRVAMADNGIYSVGGGVANQLAFVDGQNIYVVNVSTLAFTSFSVPATSITFIGGYFMINTGGAGVAISSLYDGTTWPALAASTADTYPDDLKAVVNNHNEAWLVGEYSAEIWAADGSSNPFPFSRMAVIDFGTVATHSVAKGNNTLFWLAAQRNGNAGELFGIGMVNGYGVEIVSPQSINLHISKYTVVSDAWGYCYTDKGHEFYLLTFPTENATWVFDPTTRMCHERSYYSGDPYKINRHLANTYVYAWGKHYIGSYLDGKIYEMSEDYLTDNGQPIASVKTSPPLDGEEGSLFISKLQIDAETGIGNGSEQYLYTIDEIDLSMSNGTGIVYVDGFIFIAMQNNECVLKIDADTNTILSNIPTGSFSNPYHLSYGGGFIWVANYGNGTLGKINPATSAITIITTLPFGSIRCTEWDGTYLWIAEVGNKIYKVDISTLTVITTLVVGNSPYGMLAFGGFLWVPNQFSNTVTKVDLSTDSIIKTYNTGDGPSFCASDGKNVWVTNLFARFSEGLTKITVSNDQVDLIGCGGVSPYGIIFDGEYIVVCNYDDDSVVKIDPKTNEISKTIKLTFNPIYSILNKNPALIAWDNKLKSYWISQQNSNYVAKISQELNPDFNGSNPKIRLSYSDDGGHTWSNDRIASMGNLGDYNKKIIFRKFGMSKNRAFRIAITDAVKKILIGSYMDYKRGRP